MKFFIDTADTAEIADLASTGLIDGVTTNPSLVAKSGRKFVEVIEEICGLVSGPVSGALLAGGAATVWALDSGARPRRDASTMPTASEARAIRSA